MFENSIDILCNSENVLYDSGKLWYTDIYYNALFSYDFLSGATKIEYITDEDEETVRLFGTLIKYQKYIYMIPFNASAIHVFDTEGKKAKKIIIPKYMDCENDDQMFLDAHTFGEKIVLISTLYRGILIYDCKEGTVDNVVDWLDTVDGFTTKDDKAYFRKAMIHNDVLLAPLCRGNAILQYNLHEMKYRFFTVGKESVSFSGITYDGEFYWLSPRDGDTVIRFKWHNDLKLESKEFKIDKGMYTNIVSFHDDIYIMPLTTNSIVRINKKNGKISKTKGKYSGVTYFIRNDEIWFIDQSLAVFFQFENEYDKRFITLPYEMKPVIDKRNSVIYSLLKRKSREGIIISENESDSLRYYLDNIKLIIGG